MSELHQGLHQSLHQSQHQTQNQHANLHPHLHLRDAVSTDVPDLAALYEASGIDAPGHNDLAAVAAGWRRLLAQAGARVRVAELNGQMVGTVTLFVLPLLAHNAAPAALVEDVAVDPQAQGAGVGRALMVDAMQLAAQAGCYKLALSSNRRRVAAHAFYEHLGFERHGVSFQVELAEPPASPPPSLPLPPTGEGRGEGVGTPRRSPQPSLTSRERGPDRPNDALLPLLQVSGLSHCFEGSGDGRFAVRDAALTLFSGEVVALVGESGSGKSTLLNCIAGRLPANQHSTGEVHYRSAAGEWLAVRDLTERRRRVLARTEWGFVEQNPVDGLRMSVSAGANIGERLMGQGERHYGHLRAAAQAWMARVELDPLRIDESPRSYSGGMRQRLQIARNLVTRPRLVLMDEPTSGLDVSVQARLLDLIRLLVARMHLSALIVTHDLGVARLLAHRTLVMREGRIVEQGLTDRVLDDPQHPYTQLLVSSVVAP